MAEADGDDGLPQLSAHAAAALEEFYTERLRSQYDKSDNLPSEDWQLSQFWYDDETSAKIASEILAAVGEHGSVACISCPSTFKALQAVKPATVHSVLLEFDRRFEALYAPDFVHYDYNLPLEVPEQLEGHFDLVVADPPFLNEDCLTKTAQTMEFLGKGKFLLCTGAIMEDVAKKRLKVRTLEFQPKHKNNLANEFRCFANYETTKL